MPPVKRIGADWVCLFNEVQYSKTCGTSVVFSTHSYPYPYNAYTQSLFSWNSWLLPTPQTYFRAIFRGYVEVKYPDPSKVVYHLPMGWSNHDFRGKFIAIVAIKLLFTYILIDTYIYHYIYIYQSWNCIYVQHLNYIHSSFFSHDPGASKRQRSFKRAVQVCVSGRPGPIFSLRILRQHLWDLWV